MNDIITKVLAIHCNTSGINYNAANIADKYQIVSIGLLITDINTYEVLDKLYIEIQWNGKSLWNEKAEKIHGLSKKYLENNGISEEAAVAQIGEFILAHFSVNTPLTLLGNNVAAFELQFLKQLLHSHGLSFKFSQRQLDIFSVSMATFKSFNAVDIFHAIGCKYADSTNSLMRAFNAVEVYKRISTLWDRIVSE